MSWPTGDADESGKLFLLNHYPHAICYLDPKGRYAELNPRVCALTGRRRDELLGRAYREHVPRAERGRVERTLSAAVSGETRTVQHAMARADGSAVDVEATFLPFTRDEKVVGVYCVLEEITEWVTDQRAVLDSERRYRALFERNPDAAWSTDTEGRITDVNPAAEKISGFTRTEILGREVFDFVSERDKQSLKRFFRRARQGEPVQYTIEYRRRDGSRGEMSVSLIPISRGDAVVGIHAVGQDVTESKAAGKALEEREQNYRALFDRNPNPIFYLDAEGNISDMNRAALAMTGVNREDMLGVNIAALALEKVRDMIEKRFARVRRGESLQYTLESFDTEGRPTVLDVTAIPVSSGGRVIGVHNVVQDITSRIRAEEALQKESAALAERVKELNCIKQLSDILEDATAADETLLRKVVEILPPAFQYPAITGARISINALEVRSENYRKSRWRLTQSLWVQGRECGLVEIVYRKKMPDQHEGPFLEEERELLDIVAGKLQRFYGQYLTAEQLRLSANALESTADSVMILDREGRVVMANPAYTRLSGYTEEEVLGVRLRHDPTNREQSVSHWFEEVERRGGALQGESWFQRKDGSRVPILSSISVVPDEHGSTTHYMILFRDISAQKDVQERLDYLSYHDALTGLPNRSMLAERAADSLARAHRHGGHLALLHLDLDRFKQVNDSLGHEAGDELLKGVAERLRAGLRTSDTVARLSGDEFGILLDEVSAQADAGIVAAKLLAVLDPPFRVAGQEVAISASIGIACFPDDGAAFDRLLHNAELAMYKAKQHGRANYQFHVEGMEKVSARTLTLRTAMHRALEREEFRLHYQPIVDLASGRPTGMEALLRWHSRELGVVPPSDFIPLAEETGLIHPIGEWVLNEAIRETASLVRAGYDRLRVAVNLSVRQFQDSGLARSVAEALEREGLPARHLELEITETMMMHRLGRTMDILRDLHELGVAVALDDFGTGYSSLQYLKDFPIQYLKIDKSFVGGLPADHGSSVITRTIIAMARSLSIRVIAEGIETGEQLVYLRELGCEEGQGYLLSMPLQSEDLRWLLENHDTLPVSTPGAASA